MHTLHTTLAYVIEVYPHGESNNVYKLFTRELGLLYAHAQGVRKLKSRNRYALQVGRLASVTLVRGREVWRITTAQSLPEGGSVDEILMPRKLLTLTGRLIAVEDEMKDVFDLLTEGAQAMHTASNEDSSLIEALILLRIMDKLGFVGRPVEEEQIGFFLRTTGYSEIHLEQARAHSELLFVRVNTALEEAK